MPKNEIGTKNYQQGVTLHWKSLGFPLVSVDLIDRCYVTDTAINTPVLSASVSREDMVRRILWYLWSSCCRCSMLMDGVLCGMFSLTVVLVGLCHVVVRLLWSM